MKQESLSWSVVLTHHVLIIKKKKKLHQLDGIPVCNYLRVSISFTQKNSLLAFEKI